MTALMTPRPTERLAQLGAELPIDASTNVVIHQGIAHTGAIAPTVAGVLETTGRVGRRDGYAEQPVPVITAIGLARTATLNALAAAAHAAGGLDAIDRILTITAHTAIDAKTFDYGRILDDSLALIEHVFGPEKRPAVTIHGVVSLPENAPVAIEITALVGGE